VELLTILTVIPGSFGLALLLQVGTLKLILWALRPEQKPMNQTQEAR
jgi:hypothetical protein